MESQLIFAFIRSVTIGYALFVHPAVVYFLMG